MSAVLAVLLPLLALAYCVACLVAGVGLPWLMAALAVLNAGTFAYALVTQAVDR